jgi:monoamine oxidase
MKTYLIKLFSFEDIFSFPTQLPSYDRQGKRKKVCVIGAGIAGLSSAYEMLSLDHSATILEKSNRSGGRILTHRFGDGTHAELGAMRIPASHGCTLHYVEEFQLPTRLFVNYNPKPFIIFVV